MCHKKRAGFTVIELVVTMVISTIAFLLIYPSFREVNRSIQTDYESGNAEVRLWKAYQKIYPLCLYDSCVIEGENSYRLYSKKDTVILRYTNNTLEFSSQKTIHNIWDFKLEEAQIQDRSDISLSIKEGDIIRSLKWSSPMKITTKKQTELIWN